MQNYKNVQIKEFLYCWQAMDNYSMFYVWYIFLWMIISTKLCIWWSNCCRLFPRSAFSADLIPIFCISYQIQYEIKCRITVRYMLYFLVICCLSTYLYSLSEFLQLDICHHSFIPLRILLVGIRMFCILCRSSVDSLVNKRSTAWQICTLFLSTIACTIYRSCPIFLHMLCIKGTLGSP